MLRHAYVWSFLLTLGICLFACGDEGSTGGTSTVVEEPEPADAVAEAKLQLEDYRTYYYCERSYPQTCDDLPIAYVLPRESGPFRVVFYDNQDRASYMVGFSYVTVDLETKTVEVVGSFAWQELHGEVIREGEPLWGIPE